MSHYFDNDPTVDSDRKTVSVIVAGDAFEFATDTGVFSHGRLDAGTKILLSEAPDLPTEGTFLDLGCGTGPIAMTMALRRPNALIWAVDVNERARDLTLDNPRRLGVNSIHVCDPEVLLERLDTNGVTFDVIWSNPPIKIGKAALHDLLSTWLAHLSAHGWAALVVHKNLGSDSLAAWLSDRSWRVTRLASRQGYRVLRVERNG
ncbi:MAG: class I SAM-dependent methyltransferase [Actinomycetota bacterium]